jgi:putative phosphoesterase
MAVTSDVPTSSTRFGASRRSPRSEETWIPATGPLRTPETEFVRLAERSIYVLHDLKALKIDPVACGIDVVVSGHSHAPKIVTVNGVLYLNPGSAGRRRFGLPITLATIDVTPDGLRPAIYDLQEA